MTGETFMDYLSLIRQHQGDDDVLHILCDVHSSHRTPEVFAHAEALNIVLHFVPAGMTDSHQPLDRRVFACLKASMRRLFRRKRGELMEPVKVTKPESVGMMIWSWEHLALDVIRSSWDIYEPE